MRYFCVVMLLASAVGPADVFVADQRQSAGGLKGTKPREQPLADIPKGFEFLTKTVIDSGLGRPVELWAIQQAIDSVSKSIRWTQK